MSQYTSYYLYQKYEKRGDQPFIPSYPQVYSIDGDGTMPLSVKNDNDANCGYTGDTPTTQYRWVNLPISQDYVCDDCPEAQYRWVETSGYICNGTTKYNREVQQVSEDGGQTWEDTSNFRKGSRVIEYDSADCGYAERWVNLPIEDDYICSGVTKYYKQQKQISEDGGDTWSYVDVYRMGDIYERNSIDCGYNPNKVRWKATNQTLCIEKNN